MSNVRRSFTAEQKAELVRRHLRDRIPVGQLAEELDLQPSQIHQWVAAGLAQLDKAFQGKPGRQTKDPQTKLNEAMARQVQRLEQKLQAKNEVIAELLEENVKTKKANGEL